MAGIGKAAEILKRLANLKLAGEAVSGLKVRPSVSNRSSIGASLSDYEVLPGIRELSFADFSGPARPTDRTRRLAEQIGASGEIEPLIVVYDDEGPYILEGAHRFDTLQHLGHESFPAEVVIDLELLPHKAKGGPVAKPKMIQAPEAEQSVEVDPKTGKLIFGIKAGKRRDLLTMRGGMEKMFDRAGVPLHGALRRSIQDWDAEAEPTEFDPATGKVSGGPSPLDALSAIDVPMQALGEAAFQATGSPLVGTAAYALPGAVSPRTVARAGRGAAKALKHLDPRNLAVPIEREFDDIVNAARNAPARPGALREGAEVARSLLSQLKERAGAYGDVLDPAMYAVKPRGGQWLEPEPQAGLYGRPEAVKRYAEKNLSRWIKTDLGTTTTDDLARELGFERQPAVGTPGFITEQGNRSPYQNLFDEAVIERSAADRVEERKKWGDLVPEWVEKLAPETPIYDVISSGAFPALMREALDYAGTVNPAKLPNISVPDLLRQSKAWHEAIEASKANSLNPPGKMLRDYPEGYSWQELTDPRSLTAESCRMGHCVGSVGTGANREIVYLTDPETGSPSWRNAAGEFRYSEERPGPDWEPTANAYNEQGTRIFSLRDAKGQPHVTVEAGPREWNSNDVKRAAPQAYAEWRALEGPKIPLPDFVANNYPELLDRLESYSIMQIKGKQNAAPIEQYRPFVQDLIRNPVSGPWARVEELGNAGMIEHSGQYWKPEELTRAAEQFGRMGDQGGIDYNESIRRQMEAGLDRARAHQNWHYEFTNPRRRHLGLEGDSTAKLELPEDFDINKFAGGGKVVKEGAEIARALLKQMRQTVRDAQRKDFPGIYKHPEQLAIEAEARVAPESPLLERLFGVTREDLSRIGQTRTGNREPVLGGAAVNPKGSAAVSNIITPANTRRLTGALEAAQEHAPELTRGMTGWYVMDPLYQRMEQLFGKEEAMRRFNQLNHLTGMASPGSDVLTELNRGTAANMLAEQGRFDEFLRHAGTAGANRGEDFPADLRGVTAHPYHKTAQSPAMKKFLETGQIHSSEPKVPLYIQASSVPELGFQTSVPVPDAHFARAIGLADTRTSGAPGASASMAELQHVTPWWREEVADPMGLESVPAQALAWGLFGPQTGVKTSVGAPKLELLAVQVAKAAERMGTDPETALNLILEGKAHAGFADPALLAALSGAGVGAAVLAKLREPEGHAKGGLIREGTQAALANARRLLEELKRRPASVFDNPVSGLGHQERARLPEHVHSMARRIEELEPQVDAAYERGNHQLAEDLDAELAQLKERAHAAHFDLGEMEMEEAPEVGLDQELASAFEAHRRGGWGALSTPEDALANMRDAIESFRGTPMTDTQVLDAARDAHSNILTRKQRRGFAGGGKIAKVLGQAAKSLTMGDVMTPAFKKRLASPRKLLPELDEVPEAERNPLREELNALERAENQRVFKGDYSGGGQQNLWTIDNDLVKIAGLTDPEALARVAQFAKDRNLRAVALDRIGSRMDWIPHLRQHGFEVSPLPHAQGNRNPLFAWLGMDREGAIGANKLPKPPSPAELRRLEKQDLIDDALIRHDDDIEAGVGEADFTGYAAGGPVLEPGAVSYLAEWLHQQGGDQ